MDRLRDPGGCPWDREQTPETLRRYLLEECFELLEALDQGDPKAIQEELGDVLLQVAFHARITQEQGAYHFGDVAQGIADKLLHRHPHVFGDVEVADAAAVEANWEQLKQAEKQDERSSLLDGIPAALPALLQAHKVQERAARVGFDWPDVEGPLAKLDEELGELREALAGDDPREVAAELGDALFTLVNLARHLGLSAEDCLRETSARFGARFRRMEAAAGRPLAEHAPPELEALWERAKREGG
ncbi:MAG: nucleoside triphosphate pyrophosphohydrolase [Planctomycetes bacterium]|nr:nucleoside triphosphate pyrophosphohydrolase [Planctomycetota bacterium]